MKQGILKAVKIFIYATFFVPLITLPASFIFPFIVPKILLFRSLTILMVSGYILLLIINRKEFSPKFTALNAALLVFLTSFTISTFVGIDPYHSFWDNHERMLGLFTIFFYVAYYFVCTSVFKNWSDWRFAMKVFLVGGSMVMFVALLQVFNPMLLLNNGSARVASTLGNSIYVGGYGLFLFFTSLLLFLREESASWKWIEAGLGLLAVLGMFFSGTRGSILGAIGGVGVVLLGYAITLKDSPKIRKSILLTVVGLVALVGVLYVNRKSEFVQKIPAVGRTINTSYSDVKNSPRWVAWEVAYESFKEKPLFGWGPNNFFYAFNLNYDPRSLNWGYGETWFDNAHNVIMNTIAVQGIFGILAYLSIFFIGILSLVLAYRNKDANRHVLVIGSAFLVAHLIQNVTVFENPTSYLYFMFWLAMINRLSRKPDAPILDEKGRIIPVPDKKISGGAIGTMGAVAFLIIFIFNIQPARANMMTLDALKVLSNSPGNGGIEAMEKALAFNSPHIDDIRSDLGRTVSQVLGGRAESLGKEKSLQMYEIAKNALELNIILHPLDIRNYLSLAQLNQSAYSFTGDASYVLAYGKNLEDSLKYSPRRQQIIYNLVNYQMQIGASEDAVKLLQGTIQDNPKIGESYWRLAYVYKVMGKMKEGQEVLDLAKENGVVFSPQEQEIIKQFNLVVTSTK